MAAKFPCDIEGCGRSFKYQRTLSWHKQAKHGIQGSNSNAKGHKKAKTGRSPKNTVAISLEEAIQTLKVKRDALNSVIHDLEAMR